MSTCLLAQPAKSGTAAGPWPWLTQAAEMAERTDATSLAAQGGVGSVYPRMATRIPGAGPAGLRAVREFTRFTLRHWGLADCADDVTVVVSELLTNAVFHAWPSRDGWPVQVGLLQARPSAGVICAVTDSSQQPPLPRSPEELSESGRGLHVVAELSDRWGYAPVGAAGKVVWATFGACVSR
jgi:Histidine kinase-like ATPase domain